MLVSELQRINDDFITVKIQGSNREYIIDSIIHEKNYADSPSTHLCIFCRLRFVPQMSGTLKADRL